MEEISNKMGGGCETYPPVPVAIRAVNTFRKVHFNATNQLPAKLRPNINQHDFVK